MALSRFRPAGSREDFDVEYGPRIPQIDFWEYNGEGSADDSQTRIESEDDHMAKATFGAGCFWGVEAEFRRTKGVIATAVGYAGGTTAQPTYKDVCNGDTDHAEVVEVEYDPTQVTFEELLDVFWKNHNPTTRNRQGPDYGTQYRSVVFYHSPEQEAAARVSMAKAQANWKAPIVTEIAPAPTFWKAEDYHQQYLAKEPLGYCGLGGLGVAFD